MWRSPPRSPPPQPAARLSADSAPDWAVPTVSPSFQQSLSAFLPSTNQKALTDEQRNTQKDAQHTLKNTQKDTVIPTFVTYRARKKRKSNDLRKAAIHTSHILRTRKEASKECESDRFHRALVGMCKEQNIARTPSDVIVRDFAKPADTIKRMSAEMNKKEDAVKSITSPIVRDIAKPPGELDDLRQWNEKLTQNSSTSCLLIIQLANLYLSHAKRKKAMGLEIQKSYANHIARA